MAAQKNIDPARHAYFAAKRLASLGENEGALAQLDHAHRSHSFFMLYIKVEPAFDALRADARFQELLRRMNLPAD
ncbi:MAG: TPR end-of-group domain-containing protein [Pyrinomonadaceae bacterium]